MSDDEQRGGGADAVHRVDGLLGDLQAADERPVAPRRRADAERNRAQILTAAERLFAEQDPRTVTMDRIAKAAGWAAPRCTGASPIRPRSPWRCSTSTNAGSRAAHLRAPAARARRAGGERLAAFYLAMLDLLERHLPLALGAETGRRASGRARTASGASTSGRSSSTTGSRTPTR